jgi:hypothetical protein
LGSTYRIGTTNNGSPCAISTAVDPTHQLNAKFSRLNWIAIVIGGTVLLLVVVGLALTIG